MKKSIFLILTIAGNLMAFAQGPPPVAFTTPNNATYFENLISENNKFGRVVYSNDRNPKDINEVYLFDESEGFITVYTKDGKGYKVPNANFDLIKQQLQVQLKDSNVFTFDLSSLDYFVKNNKKYVLVDHVARPLHEELVKTNKATLLKGYEIIRKEAMTNPLTNQITKPAFYAKSEVYFIKIKDELTELPSRSKKFVKLFTDDSDEIKDYMKTNHLSNDDDQDLIRIINYYNTL